MFFDIGSMFKMFAPSSSEGIPDIGGKSSGDDSK
jgi:hypothetical protein